MNKNELDKYLTSEPNNGYHIWLERVWDSITDEQIPDRDAYESFFEYWENKLAIAGRNGFVNVEFSAHSLRSRYKFMTAILDGGWKMLSPDNWQKDDMILSLSEAHHYNYCSKLTNNNPPHDKSKNK